MGAEVLDPKGGTSRLSTVDELAPGLPVSEVERAWNEAATQWAVAAGEEPLANSVQSGDALAACRGGGFGLDGPVAPTQPFARRTNLRVVFPEPSNADDVVAPVPKALAARRARQCLVSTFELTIILSRNFMVLPAGACEDLKC